MSIKLKLSLLAGSCIIATSALADVRGMNSQQLAQFAQSQNSVKQLSAPVSQNYQSPQIDRNQQKIADLASTLANSYTMAPSSSNYSVKGYNRSVPSVRREVNVVRSSAQDQVIESKSSESATAVVPSANVTEIGVQAKESLAEDSDDSNWITKVAQYDTELRNEEKRLLANRPSDPKPTAISNQGYQKQNFQGAQLQQASYTPPTSTSRMGSSAISPSSDSRAPSIGSSDFYAFKPASLECVMDVARAYQVPSYVLLGIASQERGKNGQHVRNTDGSYDLGHFQLNTIHFRSDGFFKDIDMNDAKWRGCYNAELAAWLLRKQLLRTSKSSDFWTRVAGYHSWTPSKNAIYRKSVRKYAEDWQVWLNKRNLSVL